MDYQEKYNQLIEYRREHPVPTINYSERHHIKPVCLFPELANDKNNIIQLTAYEHFMAHYFLWRVYQNSTTRMNEDKLLSALHFFTNNRLDKMSLCEIKKCAKLYNKIKTQISGIKRKSILMYDKYGNFEKSFDSIISITKELGIKSKSIWLSLNDETYSHLIGGHIFVYDTFNKIPPKINTHISWTFFPIEMYSLTGELIRTYDNYDQVKKDFGNTVSQAILGYVDTAYGYKWKSQINIETRIRKHKKNYKIYQYSSDGRLVQKFDNYKQAVFKTGFKYNSIINACNKRIKTLHGFIFSFEKLSKDQIIINYKHKQTCPIACYNLKGIFINKFQSEADAAKFVECKPSQIRFMLSGRIKSVNGYQFKKIINGIYPEFVDDIEKKSLKAKTVAMLDECDNIIKIFPSAHEASRQIHIQYQKICEVARGQRKRAGGFKWKYID